MADLRFFLPEIEELQAPASVNRINHIRPGCVARLVQRRCGHTGFRSAVVGTQPALPTGEGMQLSHQLYGA